MTPGINVAKKAGISHRLHEYEHDAGHPSYGLEAAEKMGVPAHQVFKTLVVALDNHSLAVAVIPVSAMLNLKLAARAAGAKKAVMAPAADVQRSTGYVLGGVSPLGQKKRLPTFIDLSATQFATVFVSAGRRGLEIELSPDNLAKLANANFCALADTD
ncbi:aminoacyl-tRNA deacylase [Pseudohongiella acticola]|jgi:Cys-tRNA(Pro)/Cys-tRNA(Cys) deacylase|uniref:Cys-tRNA(Pro)/Cys-tRNA(Cys) deacylase n=1 Tax=Pseudohongiella acticola TaxID=1524254 RepID=A0A1E8CJ15_9GAMM|nr:Cys-tRNA(Pro) deacylase [Pseudohongiella acticola]OFE12423.1 aminoacyl-tRNA deacylase [Pseudohongiella acticola]